VTITEYIKELETIRALYGDLDMVKAANNTTLGGIQLCSSPRVNQKAVLRRGATNPRIVVLKDDVRSGVFVCHV
jgi:hypothetical protein